MTALPHGSTSVMARRVEAEPAVPVKRERKSHVWTRSDDDWYIEPEWVSARLFGVEHFEGAVWDPACGSGRICESARAAGHTIMYSDIVDRGYRGLDLPLVVRDFIEMETQADNIVSNPPFDIALEFTVKALASARRKVAIVFPTARLNAARWLQDTPLRRVWLLTPRPSMGPGTCVTTGIWPEGTKPNQGGKMDFCWLVFERGHVGEPSIGWLHRDAVANTPGAR